MQNGQGRGALFHQQIGVDKQLVAQHHHRAPGHPQKEGADHLFEEIKLQKGSSQSQGSPKAARLSRGSAQFALGEWSRHDITSDHNLSQTWTIKNHRWLPEGGSHQRASVMRN